MKIVSTGRTISTTEYLKKKHKERRKRLLVACGAFLALVVAAILILRLPALQISQIAVSGAVATGSSPVEDAARTFLSGKYLWLVPKTNAFFYPRTGLEKDLSREFPRLTNVAVSLEGTHRLAISVAERKPFALYCGDAATSSPCYFLDGKGFIFDVSPTFSDGVYFAYSIEPPLESPLGKPFLSPAEFESLVSFVTELQKLGADPRAMKLTADDADIALGGGGVLLFSRRTSTEALASALASFLASDEIKKESDFWSKLASLDMRTENKVFYTFKSEI